MHPRAAVIREGRLRSIDPAKIVPGDTLTISEGDEILVDGTLGGNAEITVEQIDASGTARQSVKSPGDTLQPGSYCVKGRGIYISKEGGWLRHDSGDGYQFELLQSKRTPLQRSVETILYILLGIVGVFSLLLVMDMLLPATSLVNAPYRRAFSIIFGIAPTGLFMMLILKNVVGVLRISWRGALVYDPQSIEALAQVLQGVPMFRKNKKLFILEFGGLHQLTEFLEFGFVKPRFYLFSQLYYSLKVFKLFITLGLLFWLGQSHGGIVNDFIRLPA